MTAAEQHPTSLQPPMSSLSSTIQTEEHEATNTTSTVIGGVPKSSIYADSATMRKVQHLKLVKKRKNVEMKRKIPNNLFLKVGAPFVLFSLLAVWVVSNAMDGRLKEMDTAQGKSSKSLRQVALEVEHEEMMERLNKIVASDYDNTKRIKRPHEILEERRLEREQRNVWYRRIYRTIFGETRKE